MSIVSADKAAKYTSDPELQKILADAWLNIVVDDIDLYNPLDWPDEYNDCPEKYIIWLMTKPEYFSFICKEVLNIQLMPIQSLILKEMWHRKFPMLIGSRGLGKSFLMAVYSLLRILLMPKRKVVLAGAAFRQSKVIFEYMESIYHNAPLLRSIVGGNPIRHDNDMYRFRIGESVCTALPIGTGEKIRGQRANDLASDEFASIPRDIFENVLAGFAAVKASPIESFMAEAIKKRAEELGIEFEEETDDTFTKDNQIIISGTAYYDFNHFGQYWKDWHEIICSRGDEKRLAEYFKRKSQDAADDFEIPKDFNWRDYSILRIPFEKIPPGFMDAAQVARSRATIHSGIYMMEFGAVFCNDSNGFFKRSLIEKCVASPQNPISFPSESGVFFEAMLYGNPNCKYVYGIDPASEHDNFSIIVLELHPEHRRIVFGWTTTREKHKMAIKDGLVKELDFYSYCGKKIRWLMNRFPAERIMLDSQGGGIAIMESLHDPDKMEEGDLPIWPTIDPDKAKDTDVQVGLHLVEMVNFASADWTSESNHGLRKDMEDRILLFPYFDAITIADATVTDSLTNRTYDTLEDCVMELEELKDELSTIVISQTASGRDKWDTPEVKLPGGKKGRLRKDRYSALLMANMGARTLLRNPPQPKYNTEAGGFAQTFKNKDNGEMYVGNQMFNNWAKEFYK